MQTSDAPPASARSGGQNQELALALADAQRFGFELPSRVALARAEAVLSCLASGVSGIGFLDVAVGDDGTTEITTTRGAVRFTIDITPTGTGIDVVVQNGASGAIVSSARVTTEKDVLRCVDRAAGPA